MQGTITTASRQTSRGGPTVTNEIRRTIGKKDYPQLLEAQWEQWDGGSQINIEDEETAARIKVNTRETMMAKAYNMRMVGHTRASMEKGCIETAASPTTPTPSWSSWIISLNQMWYCIDIAMKVQPSQSRWADHQFLGCIVMRAMQCGQCGGHCLAR